MSNTIKWFEVGTILPDDDTTVLIYLPEDDEVWLGYCETQDDGSTEWFHSNRYEIDEVTHWAHMPEPPNMEGGGL